MSEHKDKQQATETGLQIHHLDDHCLGLILTRATALQSSECQHSSACGRLVGVCRRFRDVLLGRASGAVISKPGGETLLRFACGLRDLEVACHAVGRLSLSPPIIECLSGVTHVELRNVRHSDSIRDLAALPALAGLCLWTSLVPASEGEALINHIAQLSSLTFLDIEYAELHAVQERGFAGLTNLRQLRTLRLVDCAMASSACLRFVTTLTGLSDLTLRDVVSWNGPDVDGCIELASALPGLVALNVHYKHATDEGLAHLSSLTLLSTLYLLKAESSTLQARLQAVTRLQALRHLMLTVERGLDDDVDPPPVVRLEMLQRLEQLELRAEHWQQVSALQGLSALTYLHIRSRSGELEGCEAAVRALASLTSLRECSLEGLRGGSTTRAALGALRGLTRLELRDSRIGDTLPELSSLTALDDLCLVSSHLSEEGLVATLTAVAASPLRALHIRDYFKGDFLTALAALSSLTSLSIDIGSVTDAQLATVSTLTRLRELKVTSRDTSDVWSSGSIASVALLTRLVSLRLLPGGHVCASATSRLLSLRPLESLHIRAAGHAGCDFVRELTDGLRRLQRLTASISGLPSAACARLTQLTHLLGILEFPAEGLKYVLGEPVLCQPIHSPEESSSDESDESDDMYESDGTDDGHD